MKKFIRIAGIMGGLVVTLLVVALIGLNLYVQSVGTQARIQQELGQRIGAPVRIKAVSVTPWGGLTLSGISVPQSEAAGATDFLTAKSFELHVGIASLFSGHLIIKKVSLVSPTIVWSQNEEGKWRLPGSRKAQKSTVARPPSQIPVMSPDQTPPSAESPAAPAPESATAEVVPPGPAESRPVAPVLVPAVERANVSSANFRFLDQTGTLVAAFEEVDLRATIESPASLRGIARIARMSAHDRFFLEKLRSPLTYDQDQLDLPRISARAAGGEVLGAFSIQPQSEDSPFKLSLKFRELLADQVVSDAGGPHGMIQGKLEGSLEATGNAADANALSGTGQIVLRDGQLQQYSLLVALGQVLQIEELTQLHLEQAEAKYHITPGLVTIDELVLRSPNIRLTATGTVNFNGKLHLNSQLAINEKVRGQLFKPIRQNFQPTAEPGYSAVEFQVSGTLDRPKTNLVDRIVGRDIKDIVSGFLGGKKSDKAKKKKQQENAAPPTDDVSPVESPRPGGADSSPSATP